MASRDAMACSFVSYFKNAQPAIGKGNAEQPMNKLELVKFLILVVDAQSSQKRIQDFEQVPLLVC